MDWDLDDLWDLFFAYKYYLVIVVLAMIVISTSLYYIRGQFAKRRDRLKKFNFYEVTKHTDTNRQAADIDPEINGTLFPRPEVYLPLRDQLDLAENWGPSVRNWNQRKDSISIRTAPSLRGPP